MQDMVWTIGHSDRTVAEFITAVSAIAAGAYVVDVRSCPYSRYVPQFNREPLRAALCAAGLHYVFMGAELGAQRRELEAYELGQVSFTKTMQLPLFQQGMARLQKGLSFSLDVRGARSAHLPSLCLGGAGTVRPRSPSSAPRGR